MGWIRQGEHVGGPGEDMRRGSSIREVGSEQVRIEAGSTDAAEATIWYHVVSSLAIFV